MTYFEKNLSSKYKYGIMPEEVQIATKKVRI